jgi:peptidoglycan/LPS O-acetylase OafA/YrhL
MTDNSYRRDERLFDIDPFRGFVCLCLVGLHFVTTTLHNPIRTLNPELFAVLVWKVRLGVESFFVLAGFMVAHNLRPIPGERVSFTRYFLRRCVRLWIPYLVAVLLAALNLWSARIVLKTGQSAPNAFELLAQLTLTQEFFHVHEAALGFWSLVSLEQFYVGWLMILFIVSRLFPSDVLLGLIAFVLGLGSLILIDQYTPEMQERLVLHLPFWMAYLFLGILLYDAVCRGKNRLFFALLVLATLFVGFHSETDTRLFKALFSTFVLGLLGTGYRFPNWLIVRGLRFIGQRSYSVYLTHGIVGYRVFSLYPKLAHWGYPALIALLVCAICISLIAALLFYQWVEKPCLKLARRIRYRDEANVITAT